MQTPAAARSRPQGRADAEAQAMLQLLVGQNRAGVLGASHHDHGCCGPAPPTPSMANTAEPGSATAVYSIQCVWAGAGAPRLNGASQRCLELESGLDARAPPRLAMRAGRQGGGSKTASTAALMRPTPKFDTSRGEPVGPMTVGASAARCHGALSAQLGQAHQGRAGSVFRPPERILQTWCIRAGPTGCRLRQSGAGWTRATMGDRSRNASSNRWSRRPEALEASDLYGPRRRPACCSPPSPSRR